MPKHTDISRELRREIASGKYTGTGRLPSEAQIVERFRVSRPTAAQALRTLVQEGLVERRAGSGSYVQQSGPAAPSRLLQLGMIVPGLGKIEIFDLICGELASLARVHEIGMHWGGMPLAGAVTLGLQEAEELCARYISAGLHGVFFAPFEHTSDNEAANRRIVERLSGAGIPVVLLDRDICAFPSRSTCDLVGIDNFAGGYLLARHLIKLGAQRLAFVSRPFSATTVDARRAGAASAMRDAGLEVPPDFFQTGDCAEVKFVRHLTAARQLQAVICANDHTAAQLLQTLARLKLSCPRDLRVAGFDDVRFATLLAVPLTTIHQPCREIALTAFNAMRERLADSTLPARSLLLTPRLVVRESCGTYLRPQRTK
jgi:DNA-binding LacI/PurR family transcriptional regulator